jgi:periplasmic divalent cation tolerance protein
MTATLVYVTAENETAAKKIATTLIEERLIACANLLPGMTSIYRWEGAVQEETETAMILKTTVERLDAVTERIRQLHSYACPCVVGWQATGGNADFLSWIAAETR